LRAGFVQVIIIVMKVVNVAEAKAKLSEYLDAVAKGEHLLICKRNEPIAELRPIERKRTTPRPIGGGPYTFGLPESFFEPMPDDWLDQLYNGPVFPDATHPSRAAERRETYGSSKRRRRRT
jgi:prevent-host-death family protein